MTEKEVFYPAEEYYKKQNNCEFYLVKTDYKLLMIDDIVRILNNQRETIQYHRKTEKQLEKEHTRLTNQLRLSYDKINKLTDENEQLKTQLQNTSDQRDEFHRGARENANRVGKLEKEINEVIFGAAPRCGKTAIMEIAKETGISREEIMKLILKNAPYKNYHYSMTDITKEAMEMERRHRLNCSDRPIDRSPEATNQRILNNIKRLKKQRRYI